MKKKEIVIIVLLIIFGFIYNAVDKGKIKFSNDFSFYVNERSLVSEQYAEFPQQEMVFPAPERIVVDNPAGEIVIDKSSDGQVHLQTLFRVYYLEKTDVEAISRQARVRTGTENKELKISTASVSAFPYKRLRIYFKVLVPAGVVLVVSNHEGNISVRQGGAPVFLTQEKGNVFLEDISAAVQVDIRAGNLDAKNIAGKITINSQNGDIILENASSLQLKGKHGNYSLKNIKNEVVIEHAFGDITLDGAGRAEILGRHSKIVARHIENNSKIATSFQGILLENSSGDVYLSNRSGLMEIRHVNATKMVVENSYANISIAGCEGETLNVLLKNGNINFRDNRVSKLMSIEARQAGIHLALGDLGDPSLNIRTVHGRIFNDSPLGLEIFAEKDENYANRSGQTPEIVINNHYGDIFLK